MDINYNISKVVGLNCPTKYLLTINDHNICFANSKKAMVPAINYAYNKDSTDLENKKIKRRIDIILGRK